MSQTLVCFNLTTSFMTAGRYQSFNVESFLTTRDVIRFPPFSHQTVPCFLLFDLFSSPRNSQTGEAFPCSLFFCMFCFVCCFRPALLPVTC